MLYQAPDASGPVRLQGVYVSDQEITRIVDYWRDAALQASTLTPQTGEAVETYSNTADLPLGAPLKQGNLFDESEEEGDPLLNDAIDPGTPRRSRLYYHVAAPYAHRLYSRPLAW